MSIKLEDLYIATGYGTFKFYRNGDIASVSVAKEYAFKSAGSLENLKLKFKKDLEADVLRSTVQKAGEGWVLIESSPIMEYTPATEEEKLKTLLIAINQGDVILKNEE